MKERLRGRGQSEQTDTRCGVNAAKFRLRTPKSITFTTEKLGARRVGGPLDNLLIVSKTIS